MEQISEPFESRALNEPQWEFYSFNHPLPHKDLRFVLLEASGGPTRTRGPTSAGVPLTDVQLSVVRGGKQQLLHGAKTIPVGEGFDSAHTQNSWFSQQLVFKAAGSESHSDPFTPRVSVKLLGSEAVVQLTFDPTVWGLLIKDLEPRSGSVLLQPEHRVLQDEAADGWRWSYLTFMTVRPCGQRDLERLPLSPQLRTSMYAEEPGLVRRH